MWPGSSGKGSRAEAGGVTADERDALHPAVQAWSRLTGADAAPARIQVLKRGLKSQVYRLHGLPSPGGALIAKRCPIEVARTERLVHEEILPHVPIPAVRCYGSIEDRDPAFGWVFMEDAGDDAPTGSHEALIARWLGTVHAADAGRARRLLPERGAAQYLAQLRTGRARIAAYLARARLPADASTLLARVVARCDEIEARWPAIDAACAALPPVLVHGDIKRKNLRPWNRRGRDELLALDWELAGWGTPVPELERLSGDRTGTEATALARLYLEHAGWERVGPRDVERLAWIGAVVRLAACIDWAGIELGSGRVDKAMRQLRHYDERLAVLLRGLR
jgi:aminoglycoside phosphotransferase (APT) family kinase protein